MINRVAATLVLLFCHLGGVGAETVSSHEYRIETPSHWTVEEAEDTYLSVVSPESTERHTIKFTLQVIPVGEFTLEEYLQVMKSQVDLAQGKIVDELTTTLDGTSAKELIWEVRKNAQISRNITVAGVRDGKLYLANGRLPKERFEELQGTITAMVASFGFASP